ncbi:hypothetical protein BX666DRAFT_1949031 [Dichotomocladium elegans]|nr:hypothetical protein BX666DRAFT_1949031 [Dichotomocladium elegans]
MDNLSIPENPPNVNTVEEEMLPLDEKIEQSAQPTHVANDGEESESAVSAADALPTETHDPMQEDEPQEPQKEEQQPQQQPEQEHVPMSADVATNEEEKAPEHQHSEAEKVDDQKPNDTLAMDITPTPPTIQQQAGPEQQATSSSAPVPPATIFSEPASWQIPPSALQPSNVNNRMETTPDPQPLVNKGNLKRDRMEQRIAKNQYDVNAWLTLINDIQQTGDLTATREIYERFLQVFPTSPRQWLAYLELELKYSNFNEVEAIFTRCLKTVLSVDLWKFYLGYIRRINQSDSGSSAATPEARAIIEKAYEYVLNNVGIDREAGPIWADYIYFLKSAETTNTWEEQRKMDSTRRTYQKAVAIPLNNVEHLWKEYDQWENNLNRLTAKKFLGEKSAAYMTARTALREMKAMTDNINRGTVPKPPQWTEKEINQLDLWKQYIQWEKSNPLQLDEENLVMERVAYVYQQAFLVLRFYPEIWYDFAMYYNEMGKPEKAISVLKKGIEVIPTSLLLNFAHVELCEARRQLDDARQTFDSLLEHLDQDIDKIKAVAQEEIDKIQRDADEERMGMNLSDDIDGEVREQLRTREKQVKKEQEEIEERMKAQVHKLAKGCSLVWISYMRFARRTEGIKAARALFSRARKATNRTYHVFVASALMEYHNSKDATVAGKIFGLGLKQFADDPDYVSIYLDYLIQMNDDNNTRALFEKTLATMPASKAEPIWHKFLDYENKYGDLQGIQSVEKRRHETLPNISMAQSFLERHSYLDIHSIEELDLGAEARESKLADSKLGGPAGGVTAAAAAAAVASTTPATGAPSSSGGVGGAAGIGAGGGAGDRLHHHKKDGKRPLLEPVNPERYPRPDFSMWQSFKPTESRRPIPPPSAPTAGIPSSGGRATHKETAMPSTAATSSLLHSPVVPPASQKPPMGDLSSGLVPPKLGTGTGTGTGTGGGTIGIPPQPQAPQQQSLQPPPLPPSTPQQQQQAASLPPSSQWSQPSSAPPQQQAHALQQGLPDPVAYFVSNLPPAHTFNGPPIQADELVDLLRNIIIMPPQGAPPPGGGRGPIQQQQSKPMAGGGGGMPPPRDMPPQRGGFGGGRGGGGAGAGGGGGRQGGGGFNKRGGGQGRGGGRQNLKRRARDDYDDEFQSHKGMGPNRPPTYDLFRARQQKRHRDDPGY